MKVSRKGVFKTREWWMLIVLIVLTQWLIHFWSTKAMSSSEMISYVSFAGTLFSTILAVIAIIYSFIQSSSQQTSSEVIAQEVYKLQGIVNDVNASTVKVNKYLGKLPQIIEQLESIPAIVSDTIDQGVHPLRQKTDQIVESLTLILNQGSDLKPDAGSTRVENADKDPNRYDSLRGIPVLGLGLCAHIVITGASLRALYGEVIGSVSDDSAPIVDNIFMSASAMLGGALLQGIIATSYEDKVEQGHTCSDERWTSFKDNQENIYASFKRLMEANALKSQVPDDVMDCLKKILLS